MTGRGRRVSIAQPWDERGVLHCRRQGSVDAGGTRLRRRLFLLIDKEIIAEADLAALFSSDEQKEFRKTCGGIKAYWDESRAGDAMEKEAADADAPRASSRDVLLRGRRLVRTRTSSTSVSTSATRRHSTKCHRSRSRGRATPGAGAEDCPPSKCRIAAAAPGVGSSARVGPLRYRGRTRTWRRVRPAARTTDQGGPFRAESAKAILALSFRHLRQCLIWAAV
jgi:hypothetical protein